MRFKTELAAVAIALIGFSGGYLVQHQTVMAQRAQMMGLFLSTYEQPQDAVFHTTEGDDLHGDADDALRTATQRV